MSGSAPTHSKRSPKETACTTTSHTVQCGRSMRTLAWALTLLALTSQSATTHACRYGRHPSAVPHVVGGGRRSHGACVLSAAQDGCPWMSNGRLSHGPWHPSHLPHPPGERAPTQTLTCSASARGLSGFSALRTRRAGWRDSIVDTRASAAAGVPSWCDPNARSPSALGGVSAAPDLTLPRCGTHTAAQREA